LGCQALNLEVQPVVSGVFAHFVATGLKSTM
jgi:hypothetical protein